MMIKRAVIGFDMDGTLIHPIGGIHPLDVQLLSSEQPYCFIPATGRPLHATRGALAEAGLCRGQKLPWPLVLQNGAVLYGPNEELLHYDGFLPEIQDKLIDRLRDAAGVTVLLKEIDSITALRLTPYGEECIPRYYLDIQPSGTAENKPVYTKVMCLCEDPGLLAEIYTNTGDLPLERTFSMDSILEFAPAGVHKGAGLQKLVKLLGLGSLPLLAAGDGGNDLELLRVADISFAPANSPVEIQMQTDRVIDTRPGGLLGVMIAALGEQVT
ncbi:MAG: HAD family phosphatase [Anaerolineaceae bacterium]|nr:HAD family phosphatase [Anaerolineaceae bacterium]